VTGDGPVPNPRVGALDGLRVLAALGVILIHGEADAHAANRTFLYTGAVAGPLFAVFFSISGYVLYRGWALRHLLGTPTGAADPAGGADGRVGAYLARRVLRIYPVYWAVATAMLIVEPSRTGRSPSEIVQVYLLAPWPHPGALIHLGLGLVVWTLVVDVVFYGYVAAHGAVVEALVSRVGRDRSLRIELAALVPLVLLGIGTGLTVGVPFTVVGSIPIGMALAVTDAHQRRARHLAAWVQALIRHRWLGLGIYVAGTPTFAERLVGAPDALVAFIHSIGLNLLIAAFSAWFLVIVLWGPRRSALHRALTAPAVRRAAVLTYGTYLWHPVVLRVLAHRVPRPGTAATLTVTVLGAIALSLTTHLAIERPLARLRVRLGAGAPDPRSVAA
jgi:peptidoglycan/LPS O-acetylase OafA/YrhL